MKKLTCTIFIAFIAVAANAQSGKIDLSKEPGQQPTTINNKSNATLLKETAEPSPTDTMTTKELADKYNNNLNAAPTGTFKGAAPNNTFIEGQPQMMNVQQQQGNIGNLKTNSATYYDNNGKIRSSGTTIELGGKKK